MGSMIEDQSVLGDTMYIDVKRITVLGHKNYLSGYDVHTKCEPYGGEMYAQRTNPMGSRCM